MATTQTKTENRSLSGWLADTEQAPDIDKRPLRHNSPAEYFTIGDGAIKAALEKAASE